MKSEIKYRFQVNNLVKLYTDGKSVKPVLDNLSIGIEDQKITALTGKSGSGKSTLAKILFRVEKWDEGEILYKNQNIADVPLKQFYRDNQMTFQNSSIFVNPHLKVGKILHEPLKIRQINKKKRTQILFNYLDLVKLSTTLLDRYPAEISFGQLQRVVFVRALAQEPKFLILDEPFSAIAEISAMKLIKKIKKILVQLNIGVLYISHHTRRVDAFSDKIFFLKNGCISSNSVITK